MKVSREEVRRVAALASLEFEAGEEEAMAASMSRILDYVDQIGQPGGHAEEERAPAAPPLRLRDDLAGESLPQETVAGAAPAFSRGHFVVPKVIGGE